MKPALDAHARPPQFIKDEFKLWQKKTASATLKDCKSERGGDDACQLYAVAELPGVFVYPSLVSPHSQLELLNNLFHRDLSNTQHNTNVHTHYNVPYPKQGVSYFDTTSTKLSFEPKEPGIHKAFSTLEFLEKKLRWMTLGGQYDWTRKQYPAGTPPAFPDDIRQLIEKAFPMLAQAAIVNLYSPGDTLSLHRDVSEDCSEPLASISIGCDCIFVIGLESDEGPAMKVLRLQSGDAVLMSGESRYAWHGVPKVIEGTCPEWLRDWPGEHFEEWRGWMSRKRINLNVRQMFDVKE